jgi:hypothetical protein
MAKKDVYGPLMDPREYKALPHEQKRERTKEFYGSAWRDHCDMSGGGSGHTCQNPQEHQEAYDYMKTEHERAPKGEPFLQRDDIHKALRTHQKHQAPDFVSAATEIGGPVSDFHGYTNGKRNPNPWPAK